MRAACRSYRSDYKPNPLWSHTTEYGSLRCWQQGVEILVLAQEALLRSRGITKQCVAIVDGLCGIELMALRVTNASSPGQDGTLLAHVATPASGPTGEQGLRRDLDRGDLGG